MKFSQYTKEFSYNIKLAYPVVFTIENVLIVMATIVTLGFIASLIASSRVSKKLLD